MTSRSPSHYDVFRMLLGGYLLVHFLHLVPWGAELFSRDGMIGDRSLSPLFGIIPSVLSISDAPGMVSTVLLAGAVASGLVMLGKHDRVAAVIAWYLLACLFGRNPLIANPAMPYLGWMLLAHAWLSPGRKGADVPGEIRTAAWIVLALSYTYSGYTKLLSASWMSGDAVWWVLHNPLARDYFVRDLVIGLGEGFVRALTWAILWVEVLFAPLALFRRLRPLLWGAMLIAQLGFLFLLSFADLTLPMLLFHLLTFDPSWIAKKPPFSRRKMFFARIEA